MIPRSAARWQTSDWQLMMKNMIRNLDDLCRFVQITPQDLDSAYQAQRDFPVRVPLPYAQQIEKGNPTDPLLLQVLPQAAERLELPGFGTDPLQEAAFNKVPGLIHKYRGRVLLITSPACAIHCRYCFRRHFPYNENTPGQAHWQQALDYIAQDNSIHEVILSGGDPLSANDDYLQQLIRRISEIPHVRWLRLHTRLPVVIPQRITDELLTILTGSRLQTSMVLHINHANELSADVLHAVQCLQQAGIRLMNQSVLLKAVNDTVHSQQTLLEALHTHGIQAYYLHLLDAVQGAAHFHISDQQATGLYEQLRCRLPGFMLPRLVREQPYAPYKTWLG